MDLLPEKEFVDNMIEITDSAAKKIQEIIESQTDAQYNLRMYVYGGGCSGFQYGFTLDSEQAEDDFVIEKNNIKVLVDAMSSQYLQGCKLDFKQDLMGSEFLIENPNKTGECGCGKSFSV